MCRHKYFIYLFLPLLVASMLTYIVYKDTAGFSYNNIYTFTEVPIKSSSSYRLKEPFYFLGQGRQSYVFANKDQTLILKVFKNDRFTYPWPVKNCPLPSFLEKIRKEKLHIRGERKTNTFSSYTLADNYLKEECGLIYVHLEPTNSEENILLIDNASRRFILSLNKTPYIIQKRASHLLETLDTFTIDEIKTAILSYLHLIKKRCDLHIMDGDVAIDLNVGFIEKNPVIFDAGRFSKQSNLDIEKEFANGTKVLKIWLQKKHPQLLPFLEEETAKIMKEF